MQQKASHCLATRDHALVRLAGVIALCLISASFVAPAAAGRRPAKRPDTKGAPPASAGPAATAPAAATTAPTPAAGAPASAGAPAGAPAGGSAAAPATAAGAGSPSTTATTPGTTAPSPSPASAGAAPASAAAAPPVATPAANITPRPPTADELQRYPWLKAGDAIRPLADTFPTPPAFTRVTVPEESFGAWLRHLPLRPPGQPVLSYRGETVRIANDPNVAAVVALHVGSEDLQQCADSIIRLHAEWLWSVGRTADISYPFTSGDAFPWSRFAAGERISVAGSKVRWQKSAAADNSRTAFQSYLDELFRYAGTLSLEAYTKKVAAPDLMPGDFFVLGGRPGHAVIVLDVAVNAAGQRKVLVGQGFMPAQDFHVLAAAADTPWLDVQEDGLATPFWRKFPMSSMRRF